MITVLSSKSFTASVRAHMSRKTDTALVSDAHRDAGPDLLIMSDPDEKCSPERTVIPSALAKIVLASRKPLLLFRLSGLFLLRLAERKFCGLLFQEAPRRTRRQGVDQASGRDAAQGAKPKGDSHTDYHCQVNGESVFLSANNLSGSRQKYRSACGGPKSCGTTMRQNPGR